MLIYLVAFLRVFGRSKSIYTRDSRMLRAF